MSDNLFAAVKLGFLLTILFSFFKISLLKRPWSTLAQFLVLSQSTACALLPFPAVIVWGSPDRVIRHFKNVPLSDFTPLLSLILTSHSAYPLSCHPFCQTSGVAAGCLHEKFPLRAAIFGCLIGTIHLQTHFLGETRNHYR